MPITLKDEYGYVLLSISAIAIEIIALGFIIPQATRWRIFPQEWMKENFGRQHEENFGVEIEVGGYPDMGGGKYSQKLTYKDWFEFNSAQRAHYNFLEWIASTLVLIAISGVYFPVTAASLGLAIFIGRLIYAIGYLKIGPKGRFIGVLINDLAFFASFVLSIISSIYFIRGEDV